jgi:Ca-activated chloride channel homolog
MTFAWPQFLWLLLIPLALTVVESLRRRTMPAVEHPKILRAAVGREALALDRDGPIATRRFRPWLLLGLTFAIVALARPQWGRIEEPVFDQSREILIAVDLSRSMLSPDVKPSRLERAKLLIQSLLEKLQGERVGLVVFSGTAFLQSPLSSDYEILREFLPALSPDFLPEGGTNYRALLDTALEAFGTSNAADRFLVVLSDGEATDDDWRPRVDQLKNKGIHVIALGVGTAAGTMIPDGSGGFVKDARGAVVMSKLESATLQELAASTGGAYRDASVWIDLADLIEQTVNAGRKGSFVDKSAVRLIERFQWPLALALWCLLLSFYYEFPVRPRPRAISLRGESPPPSPPSGATSSTATVSLLLLLCCLAPFATHAAVKVAPLQPSATAVPSLPPATRSGPESDPASTLSKTVTRLSNQNDLTAPDLSELAHETLSWGRRLQDAGQAVPEGPVRDALEAVDRLEAKSRGVGDWSELRKELQQLLQKPPPPPPQQKQSQQNQQKPQQNQDSQQKKADQSQSNKADDQKQSDAEKSPETQKQDSSAAKPAPSSSSSDQKQSDQSAFGEMKQPPPPPPSSSETQRVGGAPEKKEDREPTDPTLALPLERLNQLKNQDSPAQLFELLQGDRNRSRPKPEKDW